MAPLGFVWSENYSKRETSILAKYLSKEKFFASIRSALSEKRLLSRLEIGVLALCVHAGERHDFYFTTSEKHV